MAHHDSGLDPFLRHLREAETHDLARDQGGDEDAGTGCREDPQLEHGAFGGRLGDRGRHPLHHLVESIDRDRPERHARDIEDVVLDPLDAPHREHHGEDDPRRPCLEDHLAAVAVTGDRLLRLGVRHHAAGAAVGRGHHHLRFPHGEKDRQRRHGDHGRDHVHQPWSVIIRDQELRHREGHTGNQDRGPDLQSVAQPAEGDHEPERDDQREEWQLTADHGRQVLQAQAGDAVEHDDRRAQSAIGDRGGVRDQRQAGRRQWRETQADQDRAGHRDRRAAPGGALEERAETERDQHQLQTAIVGDGPDRVLQNLEQAGRERQPVQEHQVDDHPDNADNGEPATEERRLGGHAGRHADDEDGDHQGGDQSADRGYVRLDVEHPKPAEQNHHRQRREQRRQHRVSQRVIDL